MTPEEEAIITLFHGLQTLQPHQSAWVKEVVRKTIQRAEDVVGRERLSAIDEEYTLVWKSRKGGVTHDEAPTPCDCGLMEYHAHIGHCVEGLKKLVRNLRHDNSCLRNQVLAYQGNLALARKILHFVKLRTMDKMVRRVAERCLEELKQTS